jgi:hypothetical protein
MNFAPSVIEEYIFQSDPTMGGYPIHKVIKGTDGIERFKDLVIPVGLVLFTGQEEMMPRYKENKHHDVISDEAFENLFSKISHQHSKKNKTRKLTTKI